MTDDLPEDEGADATDSKKLREVHERAMRRFDSVALPQQEMRAQSLEARRFVTIPGAMWEGDWGEQFENAPRPEMDEITRSLEKIETDFRENRLTVDFIPADGQDSDTASTLDGMHRGDSYHFKAQQARDNAFQEGLRGGFGAWRVATDYADPYDPDDDAQRINPGLVIVDADQSVFFDPSSRLYDASDADWAFVVSADPRANAEDKWGKENLSDWPLAQWSWGWDWYRVDTVQTAEYYEIEDKSDTVVIFTMDATGEEQRYFKSEMEKGFSADMLAQGWKRRTRPIKRRRVHKYVMNGTKVLKDCGYIAGIAIPIVPFYFRRDWVDGMQRWRGFVSKKMDAQRTFNSAVAHLTEIDSLAPYSVPIVADEQMTPTIAEEWARGNIDRHPFRRLLALRGPDGQIVSTGPIGQIEPPQVPPTTVTRLQFALQVLRGDDENADEVKANVSAEAMDIAAARVDAKSGIPLDNMRQSVAREGEIYLGMAREVYYEPGRKVETLTNDGQDGVATLAEGVLDKGAFKIRNDLTRGKFKVIADVQESTATKRQKTVRQALELSAAFGQAGASQDAVASLYLAGLNMDGEGIGDFQDYLRQKALAAGVVKPTPEESKALQEQAQNQKPDPAAQALEATAAKEASAAELNKAKAVETLASAQLKSAQAEAVGGPEAAPDVPSGLSGTEHIEKLASADLKMAQADHLRDDMQHKRIKTGHQIALERRQQELAEREPRGTA